MVVALTRPDSVLTAYSITRQDGSFTVEGLEPGDYILQVTLIGYQVLRRDFEVAAADVDAGEVVLPLLAVEMDSLVVSVEHVPFRVNRDTLSYNALAFQTRPNDSVEDLLRLLPGIEVEDDGSITAQGETVENVLVDGREFFGTDPTVATRNLPADAVQQIDVYDKLSDMAEFTGIPDGEEERTIDLLLREEARRGYFGRANGGLGGDIDNQARLAAAVGNEARYDGALTLNRFSPTRQISLTARANNVNQSGFSWGDYADFAAGAEVLAATMAAAGGRGGGRGGGGGLQFGGGGGSNDGFTETMSAGLKPRPGLRRRELAARELLHQQSRQPAGPNGAAAGALRLDARLAGGPDQQPGGGKRGPQAQPERPFRVLRRARPAPEGERQHARVVAVVVRRPPDPRAGRRDAQFGHDGLPGGRRRSRRQRRADLAQATERRGEEAWSPSCAATCRIRT